MSSNTTKLSATSFVFICNFLDREQQRNRVEVLPCSAIFFQPREIEWRASAVLLKLSGAAKENRMKHSPSSLCTAELFIKMLYSIIVQALPESSMELHSSLFESSLLQSRVQSVQPQKCSAANGESEKLMQQANPKSRLAPLMSKL